MKSRALLALLAAALLTSGCAMNNNNEWQTIVCSVKLLNEGAPIVSAAANVTDPMNPYVPLDMISVRFWARPYSSASTITSEGAYSAFIITGYSATWTPGANAPAELTTYNVTRNNLSLRVPVNEEAVTQFLLCRQEIKQEAWYPAADSAVIYTANLDLVFYGHVEGSEHEVAIPAGTTVTFLGAISNN